MPKGPKGEKRPADAVGTAVKVAKIATGEIKENSVEAQKDTAAAELGRRGGLKGGEARWANLTPEQRSEAASLAAQARWRKKKS